jgi:hypothetical protein
VIFKFAVIEHKLEHLVLVGYLSSRPIEGAGASVVELNLNSTPAGQSFRVHDFIRPDIMAQSTLPLFLLKTQYLLAQNLQTLPYSPPKCQAYFFGGIIPNSTPMVLLKHGALQLLVGWPSS